MAERNLRMRPAHPPGSTFLCYTPNGRKLITAGSNDSVRVFDTSSDGEPTNIDECSDSNTALVATNDFFVIGSEDGTVSKYSLIENSLDQLLTRCSLPIRDLALSPDSQWIAVASDELIIKVIHTQDMTRVKYIRDQAKPAKHLSFDYNGSILAVSSSDGIIYFYTMDSEEPRLLRKMDGLIRALETEDIASSHVKWHPDGRAFAIPTATRDIQVVSKADWERQRAFKSGHNADITAFAWSLNGALLVTAGKDKKITLWETRSQKSLKQLDGPSGVVMAFSWHPIDNTLSYTTQDGELYIHASFVPNEYLDLLNPDHVEPAPFIHDPLKEISGNAVRTARVAPREKADAIMQSRRADTPDSLDDILGPSGSQDDFIEDDDGAGYGEHVNGHGKRPAAPEVGRPYKRHAGEQEVDWQLQLHDSFQPGSTPWRGNRRYLCLNLTGCVWTVDQDSHYTVTVEFYDRDLHRDFHFTDPYTYDKACLTDKGTLFSNQPSHDRPAQIYYRPHEHWTSERADWRTSLPKDEEITSIALSDSFVVVTTSTGYVRIYTLFGVPFRIYRQKSTPAVTCASWRDYVLTIGNGSVSADGTSRLLYSIENIRRDEICQNEDVVSLPNGSQISNVFFSDVGDPCIYDTTGVLLVLQHWRTPGQARWVPLLDTTKLERLASGRKDEQYWPVAVAQEKFYCIILKGGDKYPYFPRPLLNDFEFAIPLSGVVRESDNPETEAMQFSESYVRHSVLHSLTEDLVSSTHATQAQQQALSIKQLDIDKTLLQLLAAVCVQGEEHGMRALEIVSLLKDRSGRMLEAAGKIAARFGRSVLREKITELAERRMTGLDDDNDDGPE